MQRGQLPAPATSHANAAAITAAAATHHCCCHHSSLLSSLINTAAATTCFPHPASLCFPAPRLAAHYDVEGVVDSAVLVLAKFAAPLSVGHPKPRVAFGRDAKACAAVEALILIVTR